MSDIKKVKANHVNNAFFRMAFMAKMIEQDASYFVKQVDGNGGIKKCLRNIQNTVTGNLNNISNLLAPASRAEFNRIINEDEQEKVKSLHSINEILTQLDLPSMLLVEDMIKENVKIQTNEP